MKYLSILFGMCLIVAVRCAPSDDNTVQGEKLFHVYCASCHGQDGEGGRGPVLAVAKLHRASTQSALRRVIKGGISGTEMPKFDLADNEIRQIAAWVGRLQQRPVEQMTGDADRGKQIYYSKANCAQCHLIGGHGGIMGPDLTEIGSIRSAAYLKTALIDPEADVPRSLSAVHPGVRISANFLQVRVATKGGERLVGLRINEDTFSIQLRDFSGRIHSFFKSELVELQKDWGKSPMPSYRDVLSEQELNDLVAFMASLRGAR
jgi:cytochrome c oxidase cbb3-type subunit 3